MSQPFDHLALSDAQLAHVTGAGPLGGAPLGGLPGGVTPREFVGSLKGLATHPNRADGRIANNVRPDLPQGMNKTQRPWLGGESVNSLTQEMRMNNMMWFPATR